MSDKTPRLGRAIDAIDVCALSGLVCLTAGLWMVLGVGAALIVDGAILLGGSVYLARGGGGGSAS